MRTDNGTILFLGVMLFSILCIQSAIAFPPLGTESWNTAYYALPSPIQPGYFRFSHEFPITFICEPYSTSYSCASVYFATHFLEVTDGADADRVTTYHTFPDYTVITSEWDDGDTTLRTIFPVTDFSMDTPGFYIYQAKWDDNPAISSRNDDPVYAYFTIRLWLPETTYFRQPNYTDCDIRHDGQSIVNHQLWCQFTSAQLLSRYLDGMGITKTQGHDEDERHIKWYDCFGNATISIDTVTDNCAPYWQDSIITTAGVYPVTAIWNDGGEPNYFDDGTSTQSFTLHLWTPVTTYLMQPLIQPGHIYQGSTIIDDTTFYEPVSEYEIEKWLDAKGIHVGNGSDYDTRIITGYLENGQVTVSTTTCANTVSCIGPEEEMILFQKPGIYTITWTFYDSPNGAQFFVDDPDTTRSITLMVYHYIAGPSPTGAKITEPSGRWNNYSPFSYDTQVVDFSAPGSDLGKIVCLYAVWTPAWQDIDYKSVPLSGGEEYCIGTVYDDKLGSGFWWEDCNSPGTFDDRTAVNATWTSGSTYGSYPANVTIQLDIRDLPTYKDDNDTHATGTPYTKQIIVYESHLDRDTANFEGKQNHPHLIMHDAYGAYSSDWNCHSETHHAFDGDQGGITDCPAWFENDTSFIDEDNIIQGPDYTNPAPNKGDIVAFYLNQNCMHSATGIGSGSYVFQANSPVENQPGVGEFKTATVKEVMEKHKYPDNTYKFTSVKIWTKIR